jgi:anaerobic selenocysteine-containing dehydrogenase
LKLDKITKKIPSYCALCRALCPIVYNLKGEKIEKVDVDYDHPKGGPSCPKCFAIPEIVYNPDRLKYPLKRTRPKWDPDPGWKRISWDEALDTIGTKLNSIKEEYGAESVVFHTCSYGGCSSNQFLFYVSRLANTFGTPNLIGTTHICNWHRDVCCSYTYGAGLPHPEVNEADCVVLWGVRPSYTQTPLVGKVMKAKARGAKLVVVDPYLTDLAKEADCWLQIRPGTDGALALGILNVMIEKDLYDEDFAKNWTNGPLLVRTDNGEFLTQNDVSINGNKEYYMVWDKKTDKLEPYDPRTGIFQSPEVEPALTKTIHEVKLSEDKTIECKTAFQLLKEMVVRYKLPRVSEITGLSSEKIIQAATIIATIKPACYWTWNGIEQHTNASQTNRAICILYALTGNFDTPGGNVIYPMFPWNPPSLEGSLPLDVQKKRLAGSNRPLGPSGPTPVFYHNIQTYELYNSVLTGKPYPIKALVSFGGNLITSTGNSLRGKKALENLDFLVHIDLFANPASDLADILLPAATISECSAVGMMMVPEFEVPYHLQWRQKAIDPLYECWPDLKIIFELAKKLGLGDKFWNGNIEEAFNHQIAPTGITIESLKKKQRGISVPVSVKYRKYSSKDPNTGGFIGFNTPTKKIEIYSETFRKHGYDPLPEYVASPLSPISRPDISKDYPLILFTHKEKVFCHGSHRSIPSLRKEVTEPYLEINPKTAKDRGISDGDWVFLETIKGCIRLKARITDATLPEVVSTQHGWWQACPQLNLPGYDPYSPYGANVNLIIDNDIIDPISGSVPAKSYPCNVRKASTISYL